MGFDVARFETTIADEYHCPICHDVLENPLEVSLCQHAFCSECIQNWIEKNKKKVCPIDRSMITQLKPPMRLFCNLLNELKIRCDFPECQQFTKLGEIGFHQKSCIYNPINKEKTFECLQKCGASVTRIEKHNCVEFMRSQIQQLQTKMRNIENQLEEERENVKSLKKILEDDRSEFNEKVLNFKQEIETKNESIQFLNLQLESAEKTIRQYQQKQEPQLSSPNKLNEFKFKNQKAVELLVDLSEESNGDNHSQTNHSRFYDSNGTNWMPNQSQKTNKHETHLPHSISKASVLNFKNFNVNLSNETMKSSHHPGTSSQSPTWPLNKKPSNKVFSLINRFTAINQPSQSQSLQNNNNSQHHLSQKISGNDESEADIQPIAFIKLKCSNSRVLQAMCFVQREHFYGPNVDFQKCLPLEKNGHSFSLIYEIRLLELIEPYIPKKSRILDIGSGYGFLTCCLAKMSSFTVGVEHVDEMVEKAQKIVQKHYPSLQVCFEKNDGRLGYEKLLPYHLIIIEPLVKQSSFVTEKLVKQLTTNGSLIYCEKFRDQTNSSKVQLVRVSINQETKQVQKQILFDDQQSSWFLANRKDVLCELSIQESKKSALVNLTNLFLK